MKFRFHVLGLAHTRTSNRFGAELYPFCAEVDAIYCPQDDVDPWEYTELEQFLEEKGFLQEIS